MDDRINTSHREDIHIFVTSTQNPYYMQNKWILKDLLKKSLLVKHNNYSLFDIQFEILAAIIAADSSLHKYLRWRGLFAKAIASLVSSQAPLERIIKAQKRMTSMENSATAVRLFIGQLRSIGDGIAWWFLGYDRPTLRLLAEHVYVSVPPLGPGLYKEMWECAELQSQARPFILNSITNFLRIGDITTFDESDSSIKLIEVKSGKLQTPRTIRQGKHLSIVQEGLQKGKHSVFHDFSITKIESKKPLLTYVKSFEKAMLQATQNLVASRKYGEYLSLAVFYLKKITDLPESESKRISRNVLDRCLSIKGAKTDTILHFMCNVEHTVHFSRMLAPYTIFPINIDLRFSLITGDFSLFSFINIHGLARWLRKRDWEVTVLTPPKKDSDISKSLYIPVLHVNKPRSPLMVEIPLDIICLAAMEFWMPESIEQEIITIFDSGYQKGGISVNYPNTGKYAWD